MARKRRFFCLPTGRTFEMSDARTLNRQAIRAAIRIHEHLRLAACRTGNSSQ